MNTTNQEQAVSPAVDQLLTSIFGVDEVLPEIQIKTVPITPIPKKTFATFSQLMTLAHNFNRKHGKSYVRGCKCKTCEIHKSKVH